MAILVTGHRRRGKSGLGWYILQLAHEMFDVTGYVVGVPEDKHIYMPYYAHPLKLDPEQDLPENAVILIEEAAMIFYAGLHGLDLNRWLSGILGAAGQKNQIIIFLSHHTRKLDVNVVLDMDIWALKQPTLWHVRFERRELKPIVKEAYDHFKGMLLEDARKEAFVYGINLEGAIFDNPLPDFWSDELSRIFKGVNITSWVDDVVRADESESSIKTETNRYPMGKLAISFGNVEEEEFYEAKAIKPREREITKKELEAASKLLERAAKHAKKGKIPESLDLISEAEDILAEPERIPGIVSSPRSPLTDEEEAIIHTVMARWTIFEEELEGRKTKVSWVPTPLLPSDELALEEEESVKKAATYVKGGFEIHCTEEAQPRVHAVIAEQFETAPDKFYFEGTESYLNGYDYMYAFDLTRRSPKKNWMAAGNRITPTEAIRELRKVSENDDITIVIDPVYAEDIA
jgi:hypothetical protein